MILMHSIDVVHSISKYSEYLTSKKGSAKVLIFIFIAGQSQSEEFLEREIYVSSEHIFYV